jgi:hypothetical protein
LPHRRAAPSPSAVTTLTVVAHARCAIANTSMVHIEKCTSFVVRQTKSLPMEHKAFQEWGCIVTWLTQDTVERTK